MLVIDFGYFPPDGQSGTFMRFDGKLDQWDDERGIGFITPSRGGEPVAVQASAFAQDGRRPKVGEALTFDLEPAGKDGTKRAVNVQRAGARVADADRAQSPASRKRIRIPLRSSAIVLLLAAAGWLGYTRFVERPSVMEKKNAESAVSAPASATSAGPTNAFRCDGRTRCSQMTSCEEAKFFRENCPGANLDGSNGGVPCEQQWCTPGAPR